ncbi:MAG: alpha/beta hydrolase family protein [Acidimicrobiales bacterium]
MATVRFFDDFGFDFAVRCVLSGVRNRMADVGEVLALCDRVVDGDAESWVREWHALADRADAVGDAAAAAGQPASAWPAYLRAANYRFCGSYYLPATTAAADDPTVTTAAWRAHRASFDRAVDLLPSPVERLAIPYDGALLPGYRFLAGPPDQRFDRRPDSPPDRPDQRFDPPGRPTGEVRPTVVIVNGIGTPMSDVFMTGVADALDRGYHAVTFDGPGQGAALVELGLHLRPDWEHVLGPVLDHVAGLDGSDPRAIALMGISHGGWFGARALALAAATPTNLTRPAAFVADPGIVRLLDGVLPQFDDDLVTRFRQHDQPGFDQALAARVAAPDASNDLRVTAGTIGDPFGTSSVCDALSRLEAFDLGALVGDIAVPTLVCDPEEAGGWPGQSAELAAGLASTLGDDVTRVVFTKEEGAGLDCEILAPELRNQRVYDWLARFVGRPADEETDRSDLMGRRT